MAMDWTKVKSALGTIAPWLAATFGSPVAGVAVQALCGVFGMTQEQATPQAITAALAGATPDQLNTLRAAELKHAEFMKQLGYAHAEQLDQIAERDRESAREREVGAKDSATPRTLAAFAVLSFFVLVIYAACGQAPAQGMHDVFLVVIGAAIATYKDVYGYYFGSSSGSHDKDATIAAQAGAGAP